VRSLVIFSIILVICASLIFSQLQNENEIQTYLDKSIPYIGTEIPRIEGFDGTGIKIAVIDTGVDFNHPDLFGWIDGGEPGGSIADAINDSFGSFSDFKEKFTSTTAVIQGSGWGWLVYNPSSGKVEYKSMPNQTSPRTEGLVPLLGCDVWEHAYYLNYQNKRPVYIAAWWNVVNWDEVESRFSKAK